MKKILSIAAMLIVSATAFSQTDSMMNKSGQDSAGGMQGNRMMNDSMHQGMNGMQKGMHGMGKMKDCVMMHDGKVMVMKGGQHMPLDQQMTLPNGTTVMTDGTVKMADGTTKMLKDGECIYMDGTMGKMPMMKNKMKMSKDSTMM